MPAVPTTGGSPSGVVTVEHWFDFICPYCYVAQDRNRVLREHGVHVDGRGLQIHPEIGPGGTPAGPRSGPAYDFLAREAEEAGLPLRWSDRIPDSRPALAAFEWLRATGPESGERFAESVFDAYFADGRDIGSADLLATLAGQAGGDANGLRDAGPAAGEMLNRSEALAHASGVSATPAWIAGEQQVSGLRPRGWYAHWATALAAGPGGEAAR